MTCVVRFEAKIENTIKIKCLYFIWSIVLVDKMKNWCIVKFPEQPIRCNINEAWVE